MRKDGNEASSSFLWDSVLGAYQQRAAANMELRVRIGLFLESEPNWRQLLREQIVTSNWRLALEVLAELPEAEIRPFLPRLLELSSGQTGYEEELTELITSLDREWLLSNIEAVAESELGKGTESAYFCLMDVYESISPMHARNLASRSQDHSSEVVRRHAQEILEKP